MNSHEFIAALLDLLGARAPAHAAAEAPSGPVSFVGPPVPWEPRGVPLDALLRAGKRYGVGVHRTEGQWHLPLPDVVLSGATPTAVMLRLERLERRAELERVAALGGAGGEG